MWKKFSLTVRIFVFLLALVTITVAGGGVMVWYTYRMQDLLSQIVDRDVQAFRSALALETALANQKGFVTYYVVDGDPDWLRQLGEYRQIFVQQLDQVRLLVQTQGEREALDAISSEYSEYVHIKDQVIQHYISGDRTSGLLKIHKEVRDRFFSLLNQCEQFNTLTLARMTDRRIASHAEAKELRRVAVSVIFVVLLLGLALAFVMVHQILRPLRLLASEATPEGKVDGSGNEVKALTESVRGLMQDADQTQVALARSRETLLQAEKMALVGRLAAGMAHSIRNPLTSVKMRLFSLGRARSLSQHQEEDIAVISDEIRHIDTLVENFLEFSRPPKLKMQPIDPSLLVQRTLQLLRHRIRSFGVTVHTERGTALPQIQGDMEQLTEVLVNLLVNACEAMKGDGSILIREKGTTDSQGAQWVSLEVSDTGPGISETLVPKVFDPFFTTKEDGTGLGLSIARRIVAEHGGTLEARSQDGHGAIFTINLPVADAAPDVGRMKKDEPPISNAP